MSMFPTTIRTWANPLVDNVNINLASDINECYVEISAIEQTLGTEPFAGLPYDTLNEALQDLYYNKAAWNHTHTHISLEDRNTDDHPQYVLLNGTRPLSQPISGVPGELITDEAMTWGQFNSMGYATAAYGNELVAEAEVGTASNVTVYEEWIVGTDTPEGGAFILAGGYVDGSTNSGGYITTTFSPRPWGNTITNFMVNVMPITMSIPVYSPYPGYDNIQAEVSLAEITLDYATVFFNYLNGDAVADAHVAFSWVGYGT